MRAGDPPGLPSRSRAARSRLPGRWIGALLALAAIAAGLGAVALWKRRPPPARTAISPAPVTAPPLSPAEAALRAALDRLPDDPDAHLGLARYLLDQHRPTEALWHFRFVLDRRPGDADAAVGLGRALAFMGLPAHALPLLRARLAAAPADFAARLAVAEVALAAARPAEALAALAGAGAALADSAPARLLLGDVRFAAGDEPGAEAAYQRAVQLEPEAAAGYDRLGRLALAAGAWKLAGNEFAAARARDPGVTGYGYRLGLALQGAGHAEEAEQLWESIAAATPEYAPARTALGEALRRRKDWDGAAAHLVAAVHSDPASSEAQFALAAVMEAQGDPASACYQRGFFYLQTDRPHLALPEFRRMMALAPARLDGPLMASFTYIKMQRLDLAAAEARRGLVRHPNDPGLLARLALLYTINHNRPLARQLCEQWLQRDPKAVEASILLGRIEREDQRLADAVKAGEQAMAEDPRNGEACFELSKTLAALPGPENARRALELAQRATVLSPLAADNWYQLGLLLRAAGRNEAAAGALLHALDRDPGSTPSCSLLVQIAAQENRPASARFFASLVTALEARSRTGDALWRAVYRQPADAPVCERLTRFLLAAGELPQASYQLERLVALLPADAASRRELALVRRILALRKN